MPWHEFAIGIPGTPPESFVHIGQLTPGDCVRVVGPNGTSFFSTRYGSRLAEIFIPRASAEVTYSLTVEPPKFLELPVDPLSCKDGRLRTALVFMTPEASKDFASNVQIGSAAKVNSDSS